MTFARTAVRFWWLVMFGAAAGLAVLILMIYRVERLWTPVLVTKAMPSYVASTELLVNSPTGPYIRTAADRTTPVPLAPRRGDAQGPAQTPTLTTTTTTQTPVAPTKTLVDAANLFPLFIESDAVAHLREEQFGAIPGVVRAKALYAVQGQNRYRPSTLPVMQIIAVSQNPASAIRLADTTAQAFVLWLTREQKRAEVPPKQRIVVQPLRVPRSANQIGGPAYGLPALVGFAVFAAFLGLIAVVDRRSMGGPDETVAASAHAGLTLASRSQSS